MTNSLELIPEQIAARLIENGYRPVPCEGKRAIPKGWTNSDFTPRDFAQTPSVGIKTGQGIVFVDIDVTHPEESTAIVAEWLRRHPHGLQRTGLAPKTGFLVASDFARKEEVKLPGLGEKDKVEILTNGQQFIAYGLHPNTGKPYHWHGLDPLDGLLGAKDMLPTLSEVEIKDFLAWVAERSGPQKPVLKLSEQATPRTGSYDTMRHSVAEQIACGDEVRELLSFIPPDCGYDDWLSVLMAVHEWSGGSPQGLSIADSWSAEGSKYKPGEVSGKWKSFKMDGGIHWATVPAIARANGADLSAIARKYRGRSSTPLSGQSSAPQGHQKPHKVKPPVFQFVPVADLKFRAPEYIIRELIETETLGLIFGDPGCGKSFLAVDIALSVATGTPFHGRKTKQGPVFFIAGEGHNGLTRRFEAWSQARKVPLIDIPLFKSERAAQFMDAASATAVAGAVADLATKHGAPVLIVIDTLARNFGAGDENNTQDMSVFVAAVDELKARFPGCSILIVHHSGHSEKQRARGAMALKGALDCEYRVEKDGAAMRLINTKMKDAEPPGDLFFRFQGVELGNFVQGAVLEATDAPERKEKLTPSQRLALTTYEDAVAIAGVWKEEVFQGVHVNDWRAAFYAKHTGDTPDAKRKAFGRVRRELINKGRMTVTDDFYLSNDLAAVVGFSCHRDKRDMGGQMAGCPDAEAGISGTNGTSA